VRREENCDQCGGMGSEVRGEGSGRLGSSLGDNGGAM
jgi:hypothetical protein